MIYTDFIALRQAMYQLGWIYDGAYGPSWFKDSDDFDRDLEPLEAVLLDLGIDYVVEVEGHVSAGEEWA